MSQPATKLTATTADRYALYEQSVQSPDAEIAFLSGVYRKEHGLVPLVLREDFCGTAFLSASWVESTANRIALGLDLDPVPLAYSRQHHLPRLGEAARRLRLYQADVLRPPDTSAQIIAAFNFSYCVFKDRPTLVRYFEAARRCLDEGGMLALDVYGGPDAQLELEEDKKMRGFTYVWEQGTLDAITNSAKRYISFRFPDGTLMHRAFANDWRIWSLPELADAMRDAGFSRTDVFWEGATAKGEGNGVFKKRRRADNEQAWIAYLVGWK